MDRILRAYRRRNLRLDEFSLLLLALWDARFLQKWIPIIIHKLRVKTFRINCSDGRLFQLPSLIVESYHIQNLSLQRCVLRSSSEVRVSLQLLQTLLLESVDIPEEILNSILSNCTFLEDVHLSDCKGFKRIKLYVNNNNNNNNNNNKPTKLARFCFSDDDHHDHVSIEIGDDDSQTHTIIDTEYQCKPLESAHRSRLSLTRAHLLSYSFSCDFKILYLYRVHIPERILVNILSHCPSIKNLSLRYCKGFETIEMLNNTPTNLQHFCFHGDDHDDPRVSIEIGNDIETLISIDISHCFFSVTHNKRLKCARLTRLSLTGVQLMSSEPFSRTEIHSLEELKLNRCSGLKNFKLSSRSMKRLVIHNISNKPFRVTVDAPSIVSFHYEGILPQSISFSGPTTCSDNLWKSRIILGSSVGNDHSFNELYDLVKASSQSEISLELCVIDIRRFGTQLHIGDNRLPVAVEHLRIKKLVRKTRFNAAAAFLNMLFRIFRPSFVYMDTDMLKDSNNQYSEMAELLFKKREPARCNVWQSVLEGVSLQFKYNRKQRHWQPVEHTSFTDVGKKCKDGRELKYRIHLKWRD